MGRERRLLPADSLNAEIWGLLWPLLLLNLVSRVGAAFEGVLVSVNSPSELTVISICRPYISIITTMDYGLGIAANALCGKLAGQGRWQSCWRSAGRTGLGLVILCGYAASALSACLLIPAFSGAEELRLMGWMYMLPYLLGSPVLLLLGTLVAALRGFGDTKSGLWITCMTVPIQLASVWLLYTGAGFQALGCSVLLANGAGCALGLRRCRAHCPDAGGRDALPAGSTREFVGLAVPVSISKAISPAAAALVNTQLLAAGAAYVGVSGLGSQLEAFFYMPAMAMGTAAITLTARHSGAIPVGRLARRLCWWSILPTVVMTAAAWVFAEPIWQLLTQDGATRAAGVLYWRICLPAYPLIALEMTVTGILQAMGCGLPMLVITAVRKWGIHVPGAVLSIWAGWGAVGIFVSFFLSNLVSALISVCWAAGKAGQASPPAPPAGREQG